MWHIKDSSGNSIITDMINLLKEDHQYVDICTNDDYVRIYNGDKVQVGGGALLIEHQIDDDKMPSVTLINTNQIEIVHLGYIKKVNKDVID